jgi:radical SAM protein with 4Fe4S-binding SPASM domain
MSNTIDLTKLFPPDHITTIDLLEEFAPLNFDGWGTKCILPWIHTHVWPNQDVFPCCITNHKVGNVKDKPMNQVWNSPEYKQIRKDMINNIEPSACKTCFMVERNGQHSFRKHSNKTFAKHYHKILNTKPDGYMKDFDLRYWDFRFSNVCNFKCRSCGPQLSTGWYPDAKEMFKMDKKHEGIIATTGQLPSDVPQKSDARLLKLWDELEPYFGVVEEIYFAGGEPLLMEEHYRILNRLVDDGRTEEVTLKYNTNFSTMAYKKTNVLDLWPKFKHVEVGASLDGYGARGEFVRSGTIWDDIVKNRREMQKKCPEAIFYVSATTGITNAFHIVDFHKHLIHEEIINNIYDFRINVVHRPDWLSIKNLPRPMKDELTQDWNNHITWLKDKYGVHLAQTPISEFQGAINFLNSEAPNLQRLTDMSESAREHGSFIYKMEQMDKLRGEDWRQSCPEIHKGFLENGIVNK